MEQQEKRLQKIRLSNLQTLMETILDVRKQNDEFSGIVEFDDGREVVCYKNEVLNIRLIGNQLICSAPDLLKEKNGLFIPGGQKNATAPVLVLAVGDGTLADGRKLTDIYKVNDLVYLDVTMFGHARPITFDYDLGVDLTSDVLDALDSKRTNISTEPYKLRIVPSHLVHGTTLF